MCVDPLVLAQAAADLITWQDRLRSPIVNHWEPLVCSMLVGIVLGLLGCFVVLRRMALIGDAISHAVLPGVVVAFLLVSTGVTGLFLGALVAAVLTAIGINLVTRFSRLKQDAAIGIVFTAMFAVGVILLSRLPSGTHFDLKCFLFGDPLAVERVDLLSAVLITPLVLAFVVVLFHPLKLLSFDETLARTMGVPTTALHYMMMIMLSATVVAALRSVGVIMAVAMLITPAAIAYQLTNRLRAMLTLASIAGGLSAGLGMFLAFLANVPPGPAMVLVAAGLFGAAVVFAPERGVVTAWLRRRQIRRHILDEDVLKELARIEESAGKGELSLVDLLPLVPGNRVRRAVERLARAGLVQGSVPEPILTESGRRKALEMLRAHRLWETYLAKLNVEKEQVHPEAERLEHAHDLADQLAETLGEPRLDPHGHPIPQRLSTPRRPGPPAST